MDYRTSVPFHFYDEDINNSGRSTIELSIGDGEIELGTRGVFQFDSKLENLIGLNAGRVEINGELRPAIRDSSDIYEGDIVEVIGSFRKTLIVARI
ncbi:MAG: hypothetical protein AAFY71_26715 [Bacteroidota bacterium]